MWDTLHGKLLRHQPDCPSLFADLGVRSGSAESAARRYAAARLGLPALAVPNRGAQGQVVSVACNSCVNAVLAANPADQGIHGTRRGAHDRRTAMGEDGATNMRLCAPFELTDHGSVSHPYATSSPHH
jgi:hypothetical protein